MSPFFYFKILTHDIVKNKSTEKTYQEKMNLIKVTKERIEKRDLQFGEGGRACICRK